MSEIVTRSCNKCREDKPADMDNFPTNRKFPLGLGYTCKPCDAARKRKERIDYPERGRARYARHIAKRKAEDADKLNREFAAKAKAWREQKPESVAAIQRRYRKAHPEKGREWGNARRARVLAATIGPVDLLAIAERDQNVCHICGYEVDLTVGVYHPMARQFDHVIPLSRGGSHSMENVKVAHRVCNARKNNRPLSAVKQEVY